MQLQRLHLTSTANSVSQKASWCRPGSSLLLRRPASPGGRAGSKLQVSATDEQTLIEGPAASQQDEPTVPAETQLQVRARERASAQMSYQGAAITASVGVTTLAIVATYYRFSMHMQQQGDTEFPWVEMGGTLMLVMGGVIGMEMWARWAHRVLWHDFQPGWALHESHHRPRVGPFEANDIFAIINGVPAFSLCMYGFLTPGMAGGLSFGLGLGITLFGIMYMFVHDGLVHKRFPVGPIAELPYMQRVLMAHKVHHSNKYGGVPYGLFLGPQELEAVGGKEDLDNMCAGLDLVTK